MFSYQVEVKVICLEIGKGLVDSFFDVLGLVVSVP